MSTPVTPKRLEDINGLPGARPLDEAVWQAWVLKGRARETKSDALRMKAVKWISLVGILLAAVAGLWSGLTPYDVGVRFLVTTGALVLMFQALHARRYAFTAAFGALAVLYNPVAPVFGFSGEWQRAVVIASAVPFVASLTWRNTKLVPNE